jgi:hypothetical protein
LVVNLVLATVLLTSVLKMNRRIPFYLFFGNVMMVLVVVLVVVVVMMMMMNYFYKLFIGG